MQDEQLREDAKQLLRVAYEQRSVRGAEGMHVDLADAATERGGYSGRQLRVRPPPLKQGSL